MVALMSIAAFAATMSLRAPGETIKTVDGTTTTWDLTAITANMGITLSDSWTSKSNYYESNKAVSESPAFAGGITFIDTNGSGGKCRIYVAGDNPGQGFYFGGNAASMTVPVSAGQTLIVTTTGGGGVKSQTENVSFTITGTGPYVSTATIPEGVTEVKFARNAGSATYCTTIVTKTEAKAPANLKVTSETALVLPLGNTSDISYTTDSKADVTFGSSAPEVATVSSTGVIEAVASGASVITVSQAETDDYQAGVAQVSVAVPYVHTYAAEYTIGNATYGFSDANNNYYFTNGLTMSNSGNKNYGSGSLEGSMKCSANTEYTINIPEGVTITSATVTGRSNYASDANQAYWGNLFGEDLSTVALPYSNEDPATKTVEFAEGATGTLKFTPAGNQVQYIITLTANASPEPAENVTSTYIFTSKTWTATKDGETANWTSNKDGAGFSNNGVQVTNNTAYNGANATSPDTYDNISKIVVTYNTNKNAGAGTLAVKIGDNEATTKDWAYSTGDADGREANYTAEFDYATPQSGAVTLTANTTTNSIYVVSIAITHAKPAPPAVAAPTFSPEGGEYTEVQTVTLACETVGATIFYALGSGEYAEYTQPLTISETTTISAYAQKDEDKSKVVSATYTIELPTATLAELNALSSGATFTFGGAALVVAKPNAKYVYIKDATASSLIYDANGTMTAAAETGKTITAPWSGKVSIYNKLFELVPDAALTVGEETTTITYPVKDLNYVVAENVNQVVKLEGVTYTLGEGKNLTINSGELTVAGYNQFGLTIAAAEEGRTYNIVGAIGRFNDNIQFQPISIEREPAAEITKVQISGAPYGVDQWTSIDLAADASQENVYTATLDLSETIENYEFKLVINGGGSDADNWGGWIGTNNVTIDAPEGWGYWTDDKDNETLWLYNSTTGYKTYTLTATWTPGDNAYKGWTLKIEGKNERIAGDANLDNEVTVSDAVLAVSFVTEKETPTAEQLIAADIDKNNKVEITDVQGIVNIALGITDQASASRASELADNTLSIDGNQLLLQNQTMFTGFQMDVTLENGAELNGVQLSDRAKDMTLVYNKVGDNTWRIAAISLSRTAISGNDECLLTFDVNGNGNVNIKNNIFTDANTQGYNLPLTAPTGISAIKAAMAEGTVVYDMQGRRVENPSKGLYIVNGKKVVLK